MIWRNVVIVAVTSQYCVVKVNDFSSINKVSLNGKKEAWNLDDIYECTEIYTKVSSISDE